MKRKTEHRHAGSSRDVGTDEARRSTRRALLFWLGVAPIVSSLPALAQSQTSRLFKIAYLSPSSEAVQKSAADAFRAGLRDLGHIEGKNIVLEFRWAEGYAERLPDLAAELVKLKPDVIFAASPQGAVAAKSATATIPIVFAGIGDPVGLGIVASLARPGGNITGLTNFGRAGSGKRIELLRESLPGLSSIAVLWNSKNPGHALTLKETEAAARSLHVKTLALEVRGPGDFDQALKAAVSGRAQALVTLPDPLMNDQARKIVDFAAQNRLPGIFHRSEFVDAGGLMSYSSELRTEFRQAARLVDRILKGASPAGLPVEEPTNMALVVNLKTARALGIAFPQSILVRADRVIE